MGELLRGIMAIFLEKVALRGHALGPVVGADSLRAQGMEDLLLIETFSEQQVEGLPRVIFSLRHKWQEEPLVFDFVVVDFSEDFFLLKSLLNPEELAVDEGGLEVGKPEVETGIHKFHQPVDHVDPVVSQDAQPGRQRAVFRQAHPALPAGDGFPGVQGERSHVPECSGMLATVIGAKGTRGILDHFELMPMGNFHHFADITAKPELMNRKDSPGPGRYRSFDFGRIDIESPLLDINENGGGSREFNHVGGGNVGERRNNDLIARTDAQRPQRELQGGRPVRRGDGMSRAGEQPKFGLQPGHFRSLHKHAGTHHLDRSGNVFIPDVRRGEGDHGMERWCQVGEPSKSRLFQPRRNRPNDRILLRHAQFREDGDADDLPGKAVGGAAVGTAGVAGVGEAFLLIHRDRVVDFAADACGSQMRLESIAPAFTDDAEGVLVPDVFVVRVGNREDQLGPGGGEGGVLRAGTFAVRWIRQNHSGKGSQLFRVAGGIGLTLLGVAAVVAEFDSEERGLKRVEPEIASDHFVVVFGLAAVGPQKAGALGEGIIVRNQKPSVTEAAEILGWEEAISTKVPDRSDRFPFILRSDRLGAIFNHGQAMGFGQGHHRIHVRTLSEEMDRNDSFRLRGDLGGGFDGIDIETDRTGIDKNGGGAYPGDAARSGEEGEGGDDDFIARSDAESHQGEENGVGAGGTADAVFRLHHGGTFFFEGVHFGTHDKLARPQHAGESGGEFGFKGQVLGVDVEEWDFHGGWAADRILG